MNQLLIITIKGLKVVLLFILKAQRQLKYFCSPVNNTMTNLSNKRRQTQIQQTSNKSDIKKELMSYF